MNNFPCDKCLVKMMCKECCLEQQLWTASLSLEEKLEYFNTIKDEMKVVTPQVRREFNKLKYGIAFA